MKHCAISQRVVSKLSFRTRVKQSIASSSSDFSASPSSPLSVSIMAVDVIGYRWTWRVPTTATTRWLSSSNKASSPSFIPKDANPPCVALLWPVEFWPMLKKAFHDGGWKASSIPALKQRIKKAQQIPLPRILFNTVKVQLAICTWDGYWVVYCWALNHALLGTNLPHNIDESTYFCLWITKSILIP